MTTVTLKPITKDNWRQCVSLEVADDQTSFVAENTYSLAQAAYDTDIQLEPFGIYADDEMVGFVMFGYPEFDGKRMWFIFRLMVDKNHQRRGYGRQGMALAVEMIKQKPDCTEMFVSFMPDNIGAATLYEQLGFINEGKIIGKEIMVRLPVKNHGHL